LDYMVPGESVGNVRITESTRKGCDVTLEVGCSAVVTNAELTASRANEVIKAIRTVLRKRASQEKK